MGSFLKKATRVLKVILPFILEHWKDIFIYLSGVTIYGVLSGLGKFVDTLSCFASLTVQFDVYLWAIIVLFPIVLHIFYIYTLHMINKFKKPAYLKFTSMDYTDINGNHYKIKWNYYLNYKEYLVGDIYPVCPICGCELSDYVDFHSSLYCPMCNDGNTYKKIDKYDPILKKINHMIKNKLF
jgi:hypothetical protein